MTNPTAHGILTGLLLVSCAAPPRPPKQTPVPTIETSIVYFAGTALEGPRADSPAELQGSGVLRATFRVRWFESMPAAALGPLAPATRLVLASRGDEPILPSTGLFTRTRLGQGDAARAFLADAAAREIPEFEDDRSSSLEDGIPRSREVATGTAVVASRVTSSFDVFARREFDVVGEGKVQKHLRIHLDRIVDESETPSARVTLVLEDMPTGDDASPASFQRELVVLERALAAGAGPVVFLMPSPIADDGARAVSLSVELETVEQSAVEAELARCESAIAEAAENARLRLATPSAEDLADREVASAFAALSASKPRSALRWLTSRFRAPLTQDLALTLAAADLTDLAKKLAIQEGIESTKGDSLSWVLEARAWRWLIAKAQAGDLADVLESVLLQHAGEVGRYPSTIDSFVKRSKSAADLGQRLVAENRLLLEDNDPASRVRAFDWLRLRGLEPSGFDPLADAAQRKTVLARLAELAEQKKAKEAAK